MVVVPAAANARKIVGDNRAATAGSDHDRSVGNVSRSSQVRRSSANPRPAFGSCGKWAWRSTMPGRTTHGRTSMARATRSNRAASVAAAETIRPSPSTSTTPSARSSNPPPASGERTLARSTNGGRPGSAGVGMVAMIGAAQGVGRNSSLISWSTVTGVGTRPSVVM
jgi:hypothetical protein